MSETTVTGLAVPAVLSWLEAHAPGVIGPGAKATLIAGGRSNLTYRLDDGSRQIVVRRPPLGHVLATAHDMSREYRVMGALAGTAVAVPQVFGLCSDPTVTGAPFYAMSFVPGLILRADLRGLGHVDHAGRQRLAASMMTTLADLHDVDAEAAGLSGFGRPEGFMARQVTRWSKQLAASRSREITGIDDLRDRLGATVPANSDAAIVHGDYRLDNLVIAPPDEPDGLRVRAVLDWEMATLGDPMADLGLLLAYWDVVSAMDTTAVPNVGPAQGFPDGAALTRMYAGRRDVDLSRLPWYTAFGLFKLAVILEGIHYRYTLGQTVGENFDQVGRAVPELVREGLTRLR
jgi:aminoglycoside phosphotransferase (APT) family kinase protein